MRSSVLIILLLVGTAGRGGEKPAGGFAEIWGSSWQCVLNEEGNHPFSISFDSRGRYFISRPEARDTFGSASEIFEDQVRWEDNLGRLYSVHVAGDSLTGETSTVDLIESRGRTYSGIIKCFEVLQFGILNTRVARSSRKSLRMLFAENYVSGNEGQIVGAGLAIAK